MTVSERLKHIARSFIIVVTSTGPLTGAAFVAKSAPMSGPALLQIPQRLDAAPDRPHPRRTVPTVRQLEVIDLR
jgi:hypothetical protein